VKRITKEELEYIGFVRKIGGFHGQIMLAIENGADEDYEAVKFFFLELEGLPVPFAVEEITLKRQDFIVKFEDVNDTDAAKKLLNKKIFVEKHHVAETEDESSWSDVVGYVAMDSAIGSLGVIQGVEEYPQQWLARCIVKGKEVLFPLNEDTVTEIDDEQKTVYLELPEGLINLYLE
jgi:16S rRNA processing protein RimM